MQTRHNVSARVRFLVQAAMIAALYTVLTLVAAMLNWAYGPVQFRFSEAMTVLPMFTPAAIPGLAVGCFLSNVWSNMGVMDMIFGTLATLLAAVATRAARHVRVKGIPVLAPLPPVVCNALIVGLEITLVSPAGFCGLLSLRTRSPWARANWLCAMCSGCLWPSCWTGSTPKINSSPAASFAERRPRSR